MIELRDAETTSWGWGTAGQPWACRLSQVLGLVAVLALLLALGWAP